MTEPILEVKNLCFSYDEGQEILKNINTVIYPGEKIAVIGNNGAGKSTFFLNMVPKFIAVASATVMPSPSSLPMLFLNTSSTAGSANLI